MCLEKSGLENVSMKVQKQLWDQIDTDKSGKVDYKEFKAFLDDYPNRSEEKKAAGSELGPQINVAGLTQDEEENTNTLPTKSLMTDSESADMQRGTPPNGGGDSKKRREQAHRHQHGRQPPFHFTGSAGR